MNSESLPILYGLSNTNKVKQWQAKVIELETGQANIIIESGYVDGKIREIPKLIKKGKNIGRSNETTPYEQALSEAHSKWDKQRHQNYEPYIIESESYKPTYMLPMLAKAPGKGKITFPAWIQPKLNGVCNLAENNSTVIHHSRGGHNFETVSHLDKWIKQLNPPAPLHGELYKHGWSLQKIGSYTKDLKDDCDVLEYWVYDIAWLNVPYDSRVIWIQQLRNLPEDCPIKYTPTYVVHSMDEAKKYHDEFVADGYEGAMLKNRDGLYMFQFNSKDIEKMKSFQDAEFKIIGGKEGQGLDSGCIIYRCMTEKGREFDVRPRGSVYDRQQMFNNLSNDIGKSLTVRFPEYTDSGIPSQPVGIAIRDYE